MSRYPWQNILYIESSGKTVPFHPPEGQVNGVGFVNLKGAPAALQAIPEAVQDSALATALAAINQTHTGVFSVGCHYATIAEKGVHRVTGYIEFAVNERLSVTQASTYFSLFFQFQNTLLQAKYPHAVQFEWAIMPAVFIEADVQGFTCSVKINTTGYPEPQSCHAAWVSAVVLLGNFLASLLPDEGTPIY